MKNNKLLSISAAAVTATASLYVINKTVNVAANAKSCLANSASQIFEWRFGNINYTKQGKGKPILFIHDLSCDGSYEEWRLIAKNYTKTNTVYTLDLIGCGRSEKPSLTYTNYLYVQLITDFVKKIINQRTDVIATGYSSSFVLMSCCSDNELFNKIILINPASVKGNAKVISDGRKFLKRLLELPILGNTIYNIAYSKNSVKALFKNIYFHSPYSVKNNITKLYYDAAHHGIKSPKYLYSSIQSNYMTVDVSRAVKNIDNSIFIIGSDKEADIKNTLKEYTDINSSIETAIINNAKHLPQLEKPAELMSLINVFLA